METLSSVDLGDKRLNKRCRRLIDQFVKKPATSIPQACLSWRNTKAAYRFFANDTIDPDKILASHFIETQERINKTNGIILVAQDTTDIDYTTHKKTKGLGYLQGEHLFGIKVHSGLAISEDGIPLGFLSQKRWIRDLSTFGKRRMKGKEKRSMEEKESNRWLEAVRDIEEHIPKGKRAVVIGDREADLYELFALKRKTNIDLLVRAKYNRYLWGTQKRLFDKISSQTPVGKLTISLQKTPKRHASKATLTVRFANVTLTSKYGKGAIRLFAVEAKEEKPPQGAQAVHWILLTSVPVTTFEGAVKVINWYTKRWLIERLHYVLKSGCKIEELQLQEKERLGRALVIYSIVAWKLLWITYEARIYPDANYDLIMTKEEWDVLLSASESKKDAPQTIHEAVRMMAKLGGFLGRRGDKEPGVKTLWIGMRRFTDIMTAWYIFKEKRVG